MVSWSEIQGINLWAVDMIKAFYLLPGVSVWLVLQFMIWTAVAFGLVKFAASRFAQ